MLQEILCLSCFISGIICQLAQLDLNHCKLSQSGVEFYGNIYKTESGIICQQWSLDTPHKVDPSIKDGDFVDGKKSLAKNHCRNPNEMFNAPWCYTTNDDVSDEICDVPLCSSTCRITFAGSEYSGNVSVSQTNRQCVDWSEKKFRKYQNRTGILTSERILRDDKFPERSRKKAGKYCRNPTSDPNGIWCFVEDLMDDTEIIEKEYCEVDFCAPLSNCSVVSGTEDLGYYSHFVKLGSQSSSFSFSIQLWNLADFKNATIMLAFSILPLPLTGAQLYEFKTGLEIVITNSGIGFTGANGQIQEWNAIHNLLTGVVRKEFFIYWTAEKSFLSITVPGDKDIIIQYTDSQNVLKNENIDNPWFDYYSIRGTPSLWDISCGIDESVSECEELVTLTPTCTVHKKMQKNNFDYVISFYARSDSTISLELRNSPATKYPYFRIDISGAFNRTTLHLVTEEGAMPKYLSSTSYDSIISNSRWTEFYISAVGKRLKLMWLKQVISSETIFDILHPLVRNAKWFSVCSQSVAHWAFKCFSTGTNRFCNKVPINYWNQYGGSSLEIRQVPISNAEPECIKTKSASNYIGTRWISNSGQPCLPWTYSIVEEETKAYPFPEGRLKAWNYCRNPMGDEDGPFCFVADKNSYPQLKVLKENCIIPQCFGTDCRISGIGIEYNGNLKISRSNKTCKLSEHYRQTHTYEETKNKRVYCQNPNQNPLGPWCNTTDPNEPTELCYVPDCSVNDACTIILRTNTHTDRVFLFYSYWTLEKFRFKIKTWNPNAEAAVSINMLFDPLMNYYYSLVIGNENQTKVEFYYIEKLYGIPPKFKLLQEKNIPKIIPASYWQGFWLRMPDKDLELGFEGSETPIFSWPAKEKEADMIFFNTRYISFHTSNNHDIGLNFPCSSCFVERCNTEWEDVIYPMNLWSESNTFTNILTLSMRNMDLNRPGPPLPEDSSTFIKFFADNQTYFLTLMMNYTSVELTLENPSIVLDVHHLRERIIHPNFWTILKISYSEKHIEVSSQFGPLVKYRFLDARRFKFYYFTVVTLKETTTWIANCPAPNLDLPYTNGNWSEWNAVCSVQCGGGYGFRRRYCNNPMPHALGLPCTGPAQAETECNQFECGCLNPKTMKQAENLLSNRPYNMYVTEYDDFTLDCEYSILALAQNDSPGSHVSWLKDGFKISDKIKLANLDLNETKLKIENVRIHHSGIYMCVLYPDCVANENEFVTMKMISVVVKTKEKWKIRQTTLLRLICNSPAIQYFFSDLTQSWELNDFLYIDYTTTDLTDVNYEDIAKIQMYHEGLWRCYINQTNLNLTWITSEINVRVTDPPTFFTYLMETDAPSILFYGWDLVHVTLFLYLVIAIEICLVTYVTIWYWRVRKELLQN